MTGFNALDFARQNIAYHTDKEWPEEYGKVNYVLRRNGLWEVRKNKIGTFWVQLYEGEIGGFPEETREEGFELTLPKIPRNLLNQALAFFRQLSNEHEFEAYVQFFWDSEKKKYIIEAPQQKVSKGRVKYEPHAMDPRRYVLVCEIHSHNTMQAYFSPIDDADEKQRGDRFFGVVGELDKAPKVLLSYIMGGGKRIYVELDELFDGEEFPREWLQRVVYLDHEENMELSDGSMAFDEDDVDSDEFDLEAADPWERAVGGYFEHREQEDELEEELSEDLASYLVDPVMPGDDLHEEA